MTELTTTTSKSWSAPQAFALAVFALLLGVCGGWLIRRSVAAAPAETNQVAAPAAATSMPVPPVNPNFSSMPAVPSAAELKQAADAQTAPLLEKLKVDPNNAALLAQVGNLYYDTKQYPIAIDYYERALKQQPKDTGVRTDLGTAYWYTGDADRAIKEFQQALADEPNKANALFNLGIVQWKAKHDTAAAVASWQKLLASNPGFEGRVKVEQLIAEAQGSAPQKP